MSNRTWILLATLGVLVLVTVPELGAGGWPFHPSSMHPRGVLGPLVRAAGREWDLGIIRSTALLAGLVVALAAAAVWFVRAWPRWASIGLTALVCTMLLVPAVLLQVGLRDATAPWYFTNDSTYQIELAGSLILDGDSPYGHDFDGSGLERFYPAASDELPEYPALEHFIYFPGAALSGAAWQLAPSPFDDYRVFVLLAALGLLPAALLFPGELIPRLAIGAALAANPLLIHAAWFGTADAPALLALVLAFALLVRRRFVWAAATLAVAVTLRQFAFVAAPFLAVMLVTMGAPRPALRRSAAAFFGVIAVVFLPFLIADPGALWNDTFGAVTSSYRIVGYGLSQMLLKLGVIDDRFGYYPFLPLALLVWLPLTLWLLWAQRRAATLWAGAVGFTVSIFVLLFVSRVFQNSYLVWPLTGIGLALLLASAERTSQPSASP